MDLKRFKRHHRLSVQEMADLFDTKPRTMYHWLAEFTEAEVVGRKGERRIVRQVELAKEAAE